MNPIRGPIEFKPPDQLTIEELKDAIQNLGGAVEQNTEDGQFYLYWRDKVVLLDAHSEDAAIRAAFKWLVSPPGA